MLLACLKMRFAAGALPTSRVCPSRGGHRAPDDMSVACRAQVCDRRRLRCNEAGVPIEEVITHLRHPHVVQTLDSAVALLRLPSCGSPVRASISPLKGLGLGFRLNGCWTPPWRSLRSPSCGSPVRASKPPFKGLGSGFKVKRHHGALVQAARASLRQMSRVCSSATRAPCPL